MLFSKHTRFPILVWEEQNNMYTDEDQNEALQFKLRKRACRKRRLTSDIK